MAIPDFQSVMLPLLRFAGDEKEHTTQEAASALGAQLVYANAGYDVMPCDGSMQKFLERVGWARSYLTMAGLLDYKETGSFRISEAGREVLRSETDHIDINFLRQFPKFEEERNGKGNEGPDQDRTSPNKTTEEILDEWYIRLKDRLIQELRARVSKCKPDLFKRLIVDLLGAMGYVFGRSEVQALSTDADGGIDSVIRQDKLGLEVIRIQARQSANVVGIGEIQQFYGSMAGIKAGQGVFITTSEFTPSAIEYCGQIDKKILMISGVELAELMIDLGIGVTEVQRYTVCKVDRGYFEEG
jgi:restriction system protein